MIFRKAQTSDFLETEYTYELWCAAYFQGESCSYMYNEVFPTIWDYYDKNYGACGLWIVKKIRSVAASRVSI